MVNLGGAFDSVWIEGFIVKMHYLGIIGNTWSPIEDFLQERRFAILIVDSRKKTSKLLRVRRRVRFITCCFKHFRVWYVLQPNCQNYKYADDLTILTFGSNASSALNDMQNNKDLLKNWLHTWLIQGQGRRRRLCFSGRRPVLPIATDNISNLEKMKWSLRCLLKY